MTTLARSEDQRIQGHLARVGYLGESRKRSWAKSLLWRLIGIFVLGAIAWAITGNWAQMTVITVLFHSIRLVMYYWFERWWDRISWGRIKVG